MTKLLIGIQARSGSTRLPRKAFELISGKMLLDHVIENCKNAAKIIERKTYAEVVVAVLTPKDDPIAAEFCGRVNIFEGSHYDVLDRYACAIKYFEPDYVCRITGDCPMIPPFVICNLAEITLRHGYDYMSNSDPRFRTAVDGYDCEVISRRLFDEMAAHATDPYDREHVTPWARKSAPSWAKLAIAVNNHDLSHIKLSVDTAADLEYVRQAYAVAGGKYDAAKAIYRHGGVYRP